MMTSAPAVVHPWVGEAARRVRFGIETVAFAPWPVLRAFGQAVDDLGFDSLWLSDHPMMAGSATWTHLAALAEVTRRVRLGPLVANAAYANPVIVARATADLDLISGGRAALGLGSGNIAQEFAQLGVLWQGARGRLAALEEALQIIGPLLRRETVTVTTGRFRAEGAMLNPPPMQQPHVPILVGGGGEQTTLRLVARYADASNLGTLSRAEEVLSPNANVRKHAALDRHLADVSRAGDTVLRTGLLPAFLSANADAAWAKRAALSPAMGALYEHVPFVETAELATQRVTTMLAAGMRYVIFVVMPGDEETLLELSGRVLPAVS
jgi:alkanesulfonate monooxygenase SsuD/methylene tetrahydromethanopterin reductase-like flavin-dependent oxidoreductase (luciferase family)